MIRDVERHLPVGPCLVEILRGEKTHNALGYQASNNFADYCDTVQPQTSPRPWDYQWELFRVIVVLKFSEDISGHKKNCFAI